MQQYKFCFWIKTDDFITDFIITFFIFIIDNSSICRMFPGVNNNVRLIKICRLTLLYMVSPPKINGHDGPHINLILFKNFNGAHGWKVARKTLRILAHIDVTRLRLMHIRQDEGVYRRLRGVGWVLRGVGQWEGCVCVLWRQHGNMTVSSSARSGHREDGLMNLRFTVTIMWTLVISYVDNGSQQLSKWECRWIKLIKISRT